MKRLNKKIIESDEDIVAAEADKVNAKVEISEAEAQKNSRELSKQLKNLAAIPDNRGGREIWMPTDDGTWHPRPAQAGIDATNELIDDTLKLGIAADATQWKRVVYEKCAVKAALDGLMRPAGVYKVSGMKLLAAADMPYWRDADGERPEGNSSSMAGMWEIIQGNLPKDISQEQREIAEHDARMATAWLFSARRRLKTYRKTGKVPRDLPVLALVGAQGCGKTLLLKKIFPIALGADALDVSRYYSGATDFTGHIETTPLLTIDDSLGGLGLKARQTIAQRVKAGGFGAKQEIHLKGVNPIMIKLPWAVVLACNEDEASLRMLPVLSEQDKHKLLIVRVKGKLSANETMAEKEAWDVAFDDPDEQKRFCHDLDALAENWERKRPKWGWDGRQCVKGGCADPDLEAKIGAVSPEGAVADVLNARIFQHKRLGEQKDITKMRMKVDILPWLQELKDYETLHAFNIACPTQAAKVERVGEYLEKLAQEIIDEKSDAKRVRIGKDPHTSCKIYDLSLTAKAE